MSSNPSRRIVASRARERALRHSVDAVVRVRAAAAAALVTPRAGPGAPLLCLCDAPARAHAVARALRELAVTAVEYATAAEARDRLHLRGRGRAAVVVPPAWPPHDELRLAAGSGCRVVVVCASLREEEVPELFRLGAHAFVQATGRGELLEALAELLAFDR